MTRLLTALALLVILAYGAWEAYPLLAGPALQIDSPQQGASYPGGAVTITGRLWRAATFTLNGEPLLADETGRFATTLAFPPGGSILTFVATDRFGRRTREERYLYVP